MRSLPGPTAPSSYLLGCSFPSALSGRGEGPRWLRGPGTEHLLRGPAQLGAPGSAAAPRPGGSSRSRPRLALSCHGAHHPQGLADPLARCPQPLAREHGHHDTGLEREGGDGGSRGGDTDSRAAGCAEQEESAAG